VRLAQSPRELSSPVSHIRCAELAQLWLNPIMSILPSPYGILQATMSLRSSNSSGCVSSACCSSSGIAAVGTRKPHDCFTTLWYADSHRILLPPAGLDDVEPCWGHTKYGEMAQEVAHLSACPATPLRCSIVLLKDQ